MEPVSVQPGPAPSAENVARVERALRARLLAWHPVGIRGAETNRRWVVRVREGPPAFVKVAATDEGADWLRNERAIYRALPGAPFLAQIRGWSDDGERPVLAIEDLSDAEWPPPWDLDGIGAVRRTLEEVASATPPAGLPRATESRIDLNGWPEIAADPAPFLRLGLCSAAWLESALPDLSRAAERAEIGGDSLLHMDVRSDNLCLRDGRAILVDWNWASVGNPAFDFAAWLPSLHAEGGPVPDELLTDDGAGFASLLAGHRCAHAARPSIPGAPRVRKLQLAQARAALPWAARSLGLPPPR